MKKKYSYIYVLECRNKNEKFYKIGKANHKNIKKRYPTSESMPYEYELLYMIKVNRKDVFKIESNLHDLHKHYSYIPNITFNGYTECFSVINRDCIGKIKNLDSVPKNGTCLTAKNAVIEND